VDTIARDGAVCPGIVLSVDDDGTVAVGYFTVHGYGTYLDAVYDQERRAWVSAATRPPSAG
jgi:hypothetical protein